MMILMIYHFSISDIAKIWGDNMTKLKTVVALAPYNILVSFNEIKTDDTIFWFTDEELDRAKNRKYTYKKDAEPEPLKEWEFKSRY